MAKDVAKSHPARMGDLGCKRSGRPQLAAILRDRPRRAGPYPGGGTRPAEPGILVARALGFRLHVLCCWRQTYGVHSPD